MKIRRKRTLEDLCDVTPTLPQPQITPSLSGDFRMQGPSSEAKCDSQTNMVTSENNIHYSGRSQKNNYNGNSGTCNVCSAPCSSCFHVNKGLLESNNESAGETCAGNTETGQLSILSAVGGMETSDSFSENAAGKASRTSSASASDDSVLHSKRDGRRSPEGHDDCLSCVSATDQQKIQNTSQASNDEDPHVESPTKLNGEKPSDTVVELLKGSSEHFNSSSANGMASDYVCGDPSKMDLNSIEKNDDMEVEIHPDDESDDSDMVEQDVKVCDICGDAGREDLLAICSRCSDGAEHTYCMRETLEKVPEGEWFCEECMTMELVGNGKQEKVGRMDENEKNNSSGRASENLINSDVEGHRRKGSTKTSKRARDDEDAEVSSIAKKSALESFAGLEKKPNPKIALSRECSLKNLDKSRPQSPNRPTLDTIPVNDAIELEKPASDARGLNSRGTFAKSNSFNSLNSKPKVKLVDQVVIQRQKSAKEHGSFLRKDGVDRSIGKSMSFRSTNSNNSESKIKMLSPRSSHVQEVRNTKEKNAFERQRSFRTEHRANNSMMATSTSPTSRLDKKTSSRVDSSSLMTSTNHYEVKQVQVDGKSATLSRSSSLTARRTADLPCSTGEFKRPSKLCRNTTMLSSVNGVNNNAQTYSQGSLKQDPASCLGVSDKLPVTASGDLSDGSRLGPPSASSSRDESDNLKAAIEAAQLRKPGVYRKHKYFSQSDESSLPSMAPVSSHTDHMLSARNRQFSSDIDLAERPAVSRNLTADRLKEETLNSVKQSFPVPAEGLSSGSRDGVRTGLFLRNTFSNVPVVIPLHSIAIPKHEYTWQGSFEICRSGEKFELWDGVQAHLSTCASSKVFEAVNKFENRIVLHEVSRAITWPVQFQENGVREDNIALFFFAKDTESHEKIYKVLLDNMMKNDLALRGSINGVEILIFPSNQLPVNLQRWNMLFFLWGVFRGKKESSLPQMPEPVIAPRDIPLPIMSLPDNRCSLRPVSEHASQDILSGLELPASEELHGLTKAVNRDIDIDVSPLDQLHEGLSSSASSAEQSGGAKPCGELRGSYQEGGNGISASCSPPVAMEIPSSGTEQRLMQPDTTLGNAHSPLDSCKSVDGIPKEGTGGGAITEKACHQNQLNSRMVVIDLSTDEEAPLEDDRCIRDLNMEPARWLFNRKEPTPPWPSSLEHHTLSAGTSQVSTRKDDMHNEICGPLEKVHHVPTISYAPQNQHGEAGVGINPNYHEHAERYFFPVQSQPMKGLPLPDGSTPWKTHLLDADRLNDRAPNLELALGAETPPLTLGIEPLMVSKVDRKVQDARILEEARKKAEEDVSASLSLSLAFPFPEKETDAKPSFVTEQLMSQRKHGSTSSRLLFGNSRDS